jgi:hypothetical protein
MQESESNQVEEVTLAELIARPEESLNGMYARIPVPMHTQDGS